MFVLPQELDWGVLNAILENLPLLLQNKTIILSGQQNQVDALCSRLCAMVSASSTLKQIVCSVQLS